MEILLSSCCLVSAAVVKQQQEEVSRNHVASLFAVSDSHLIFLNLWHDIFTQNDEYISYNFFSK